MDSKEDSPFPRIVVVVSFLLLVHGHDVRFLSKLGRKPRP